MATKKRDDSRERVHVMLRKSLMDKLRRRAASENRPLSRQMETILEEALAN